MSRSSTRAPSRAPVRVVVISVLGVVLAAAGILAGLRHVTSDHVTAPVVVAVADVPMVRPLVSPSTTRRTHCVARPSACGYPDATTTGVSPDSALVKVPEQVTSGPGWHYDPDGWITVDGDGAVLRNLDVRVPVEIWAADVTVNNSRIQVSGESWGIGLKHSRNAAVADNEISSPVEDGPDRLLVGVKDVYGDATGTRVTGNDIFHVSTGVQTHEGLIQGNYIHDLGHAPGDHLNGTTSNGATTPMSIIGNTILNQHDQTDAISLFQDFGREGNRLIQGNLVAGGSYTIYGGANAGAPPTTNVRIIDNRFSAVYFPRGGTFGPLGAFAAGGDNIFSGNIWDETLKPVTP